MWPRLVRSSFPRVFPGVKNLSTKQPEELVLEYLDQAHLKGVVVFHMNRPKAKNALGANMAQQFHRAIEQVRYDPQVRVIVLNSTVPKVFSAGADLKERLTMSPAEAASTVNNLRTLFTNLEELSIPTIAAIEGAALGGGMEMALSCDFRIAGEKAIFGAPEAALAIIPGAGGTQRLPRLIGLSKAKELIFTARRISTADALTIGLVDYSVAEGESYQKALSLAREILPNGPIAVRMAKEAITNGIRVDQTTGMAIERGNYAQVIATKDRMEGLKAFQEKRKPNFKGE